MWVALLSLCLVVTGCAEPTASSDVGSPPSEESGSGPREWPDVDTVNMDCVVDYPEDLKSRAVAFDGTIEGVVLATYDANAGATPARMEIRTNEVFRGDIEDFVVMRTWDFMLPDGDLRGTRILAAAGQSLDLMGCGFTRPYSTHDAKMWRETFSKLSPEECGEERLDCGYPDGPPVAPARCTQASYEYAIYSNIDGGVIPFSVLGCNDDYLTLRVDLGAGSCAPEATKEERKECARLKTAYFVAKGDQWKIITYESQTRCDYVQSIEPAFPTAFCTR